MEQKRAFNLNTVLLLITLAGLVVLYILFFTAKQTSNPVALTGDSLPLRQAAGLNIVYVNIDTLNEHYEFVNVLKRDLESTGGRLQREVLSEQATLEKEASDFQRKVQANILSEDRARVLYEELMTKQQALMEKKERYTQLVAEQELNMNIRLLDTVDSFLKRFNLEHKYDFILAYRTAGEILVANDRLDITNKVLDLLNAEFNSRKK
ncbi:MAG: OmpH family outer membrane protein [bacterium]